MSNPSTPVEPPHAPQPDTSASGKRNWFARHKIATVLGALVVVGIISVAGSGGGGTTPPSADGSAAPQSTQPVQDVKPSKAAKPAKTAEPTKAEKKAPGIGDAVRDGKFEFTVTSVKPGVKAIGTDGFDTKAQGEFVLVKVKVQNIGDEAQLFDGSSQSAFDAKDRTFSSDGSAAIYLENSESFLNEINPGNTVEATVVFDVPKGTDLTKLELHDSAFSGGATVAL